MEKTINKSPKLTIFLLLLTEIIIYPLVVPLLATLLGSLLGSLLTGIISIDDLAAILLVFTIASLVLSMGTGAVCGLIFKRFNPMSKGSVIALFSPLIYAMVVSLILYLCSSNNLLIFVYGSVAVSPLSLVYYVFFSVLMTSPGFFAAATILGYFGFCFMFLVVRMRKFGKVRQLGKKAVRILSLMTAAVFLLSVVFGGIVNGDILEKKYLELRYGKQMTESQMEYSLDNIAPFKEGNGLAKLDGVASLQFDDVSAMPVLDGATAAYPVYAAWAEAVYSGLEPYASSEDRKDYSFVRDDNFPYNVVNCYKTADAYRRLVNKKAEIFFGAEPSAAQIAEAKEKDEEFEYTLIGYEAFVFFVNRSNPVEGLSKKQIQDIYTGKIKSWNKVGGKLRSIDAYQRPEGSGSQTIMEKKVMSGLQMAKPPKYMLASGMEDIVQVVDYDYRNTGSAIGYSFLYFSSHMYKGDHIKHLSIDGIMPTVDTIRDGTYPYVIPVYAVTLKSNTNPNVDLFLDWATGPQGQELLEKTGYTGI